MIKLKLQSSPQFTNSINGIKGGLKGVIAFFTGKMIFESLAMGTTKKKGKSMGLRIWQKKRLTNRDLVKF